MNFLANPIFCGKILWDYVNILLLMLLSIDYSIKQRFLPVAINNCAIFLMVFSDSIISSILISWQSHIRKNIPCSES